MKGREVHIYSPAQEDEFDEIKICDHIVLTHFPVEQVQGQDKGFGRNIECIR